MKNGNKIEQTSLNGRPIHHIHIVELFCYRHPMSGMIVKKEYKPVMKAGKVKNIQYAIDAAKQSIVRYNTKVTAEGSRPITDWWWEPHGDPPGRYNPDGSPVDWRDYLNIRGDISNSTAKPMQHARTNVRNYAARLKAVLRGLIDAANQPIPDDRLRLQVKRVASFAQNYVADITPKSAGAVLRQLGIKTKRGNAGYVAVIDPNQIQKLASAYDIQQPIFNFRIVRCQTCRAVLAAADDSVVQLFVVPNDMDIIFEHIPPVGLIKIGKCTCSPAVSVQTP